MHLRTTCGIFGLLMAVLLHVAVAFPVEESALAQRESYLAADEVFGPELKERAEREKRKGGGFLEPVVEASFGVKSKVIGIIFGKINQLIDSKNRWVEQLDRKNIELNRRVLANQNCNTATRRPPMSTTTEDAVEFDSRRVSLELPGELFGASFSLITDISKIIGDVILNTAERAQRFVEAAKPVIGRAFGIRPSRRRLPNRIGSSSASIASSSSSSSSDSSSSSSASSSSNSIRDTRSYIDPYVDDTNLIDTGS